MTAKNASGIETMADSGAAYHLTRHRVQLPRAESDAVAGEWEGYSSLSSGETRRAAVSSIAFHEKVSSGKMKFISSAFLR